MQTDAAQAMKQLEGIAASTISMSQLRVHALSYTEEDRVRENLTLVWETTLEIQRSLTSPAIMESYRADAVAQIIRVGELISEMGIDPDHRQLMSIGMATELAVEKVRTYREMVTAAATIMLQSSKDLEQEVL